MSNENHQDKKLENAVHIAEPLAAVAGHVVEHNVDGGFYFNHKLKMGVGLLNFFDYHDKQPSHLSPWDKFQDSLIHVGADELAIALMTKVLGGTVTLGVELGDGIHSMLDHAPNYPRQLRESMEETITEYRNDPNYKPSFFKDAMMDSHVARLREREMDEEGVRLMAKGAHELKEFVAHTIKGMINNTIEFLSPKEVHASEITTHKAVEMLQDIGYVITDWVKVKEKLKDKNIVELVFQINNYLSKKGFMVKEIQTRRAGARHINLSHLSKDELVKKNIELLRPYNINPQNLDKETHIRLQQYQVYYQKKLQKEEIAKSTIMKYQIAHEGFGAIAELGNAINNPTIHKIGQIGQGLATVYLNIAKLSGVFGPLQGLAAIHPVLTIATTIFSLVGLFNRKSDGLGKAVEAMMQQLRAISSQVAAMHRDLIDGINFLAAGQQKIYSDMIENFYRVINIIQNEHRSLGVFLGHRLDQIDERLILLHQQLNSGIRALHLNEFEKLMFEFSEALHSAKHADKDREEIIRKLKIDKLSDLEHWILNRAASKELNGHAYTNIIVNSPVQNAESLLMNTLLFDGGNSQLSYFISYLASTVKTVLGEEAKKIFEKIKIDKLINPEVWLESVGNYIEIRQKFLDYDISYDRNGDVLTRIKGLANDYQSFIHALNENQPTLFKRLLSAHRYNIELLQNKAKEKYLTHISSELILTKSEPTKSKIKYHYDENKIRHDVNDSQLKELIVRDFENYEQFIKDDINGHHKKWQNNLGKLLSSVVLNSSSNSSLYDYFDRPAYPIARHRKNTAGGNSYLEVYHVPEHFSHFEDYDFQIPFSLTSLFDHDASLRESIPKVCYLAEALGLGYFEISVVAHYVRSNHVFTDPDHKILNQYNAYYNYNYEFELFFVNDVGMKKTRTKIADFDCHAEQIPLNNQIINAAKLMQLIKQRMVLVHGAPINTYVPVEYWWLGNINAKLNVIHQVKYLQKVNRFVNSLTNQQESILEQELKPVINAKIAELRSGYFHYFIDAEKRADLHLEFDNINISRNLILSLLYLLGYEQSYIDQVRSLFSSSSFNNHAHKLIEHANQQAQLSTTDQSTPTVDVQLVMTALGDVLVNADIQAMQTLTNITTDLDIKNKLTGYRLDNILLVLERIEALRAMEKEPHHLSLPIIPTPEALECGADGRCDSVQNTNEGSSAWPFPGAAAHLVKSTQPHASSASIATPFFIKPLQLLYGMLYFKNNIYSSNSIIYKEGPNDAQAPADSFKVSCQLGSLEQVPLLQCNGADYITYVFPRVSDAPEVTVHQPQSVSHSGLSGDKYNKSSCRPIEFYGKQAVYCEGENTTLVHSPQLPTPPLQNMDGQLMLFSVGYHLVKQTIGWLRGDKSNELKKTQFIPASNDSKKQQLDKLNCELDRIEKQLEKFTDSLKNKELKWIVDGLDYFRFDINKLKNRKSVSIDQLKKLSLDINYFCDTSSHEIKTIKIHSESFNLKNGASKALNSHGIFASTQSQHHPTHSMSIVKAGASANISVALPLQVNTKLLG